MAINYHNYSSLHNESHPTRETLRSAANFIRNHHISLIIFIGILMRLPFVFEPEHHGFQGATWRQTDTASIAHNFIDQENIFFPQIHWGGDGAGFVETEFQLYPFLVSLVYEVFGEHIAFGLFISLLFSAGSFIAFYNLARYLLPPVAATLALVFFIISPLVIEFSVVFMPEPTVLFFYIAALGLFVHWLHNDRSTFLLLAALSTAIAILVKPTSVHIGFVFLMLVFEKHGFRFFRDPRLWLFAVISLLPGILWYLHARNLYLDYGNTFGIISGGDSKFDNLNYWFSPGFYKSVLKIDLFDVFAVGGVIPFVIGLMRAWHNRKYRFILYGTLAIVVYYLLIPRYISFATYYHLYTVPYAALGIGLGLAWLFEYRSLSHSVRQYKFLLGGLAVAIILLFTSVAYLRYLKPNEEILWECSQNVMQVVPENAKVIVSTTSASEDNGVPNNYQEPNIFFYSHRYGWSLPANWHTPEKIASYHQSGGQYFIMYSQDLYQSNPQLVRYLDQNARQIGPGIENGCAIYRFD